MIKFLIISPAMALAIYLAAMGVAIGWFALSLGLAAAAFAFGADYLARAKRAEETETRLHDVVRQIVRQ